MIARWQFGLRLALALFYLAAGTIHLAHPAPFLTVLPDWVPAPRATIALTGLCELAGAVALFVPRLRWWAGAMLAAYAVCVYPANVKHAWLHATTGMAPGWWYHGPRLLLQPVIVWWALFAADVTRWPFGKR